ncbi:MAG: exodeoxyribonuclease VII large subunit [Anaerolineales bacterium]
MSVLALFGLQSAVWSPGQLNRHVRQVIESDYRLSDLWLAGEVANLSHPASGHLYFSVRDAEAAVRCVMWRPDVARLPRLLRDGEAVEAHGHLSVYEAGGQYQLYADQIRYAGEGDLYQEYLRLKAALEAEGLFDPVRKRALPKWPRRIGVVSSPTGAALRDVVNVLRRRYPLAQLILSPTPVQGEAAPDAIAEALGAVNQYGRPDVILLVRGGGSLEDLWAFNTEAVVRAVVASAAPVVTGIGHETDVHLADFAADRQAPTPSAAAEVATPERAELLSQLEEFRQRLARAWRRRRETLRARVGELWGGLTRVSPQARIANARQRSDELARRLGAAVHHRLALRQIALRGVIQTLGAVGPDTVLARGYAVVRRLSDGELVRSIAQVRAGDSLGVRVSDGSFGARAEGS